MYWSGWASGRARGAIVPCEPDDKVDGTCPTVGYHLEIMLHGGILERRLGGRGDQWLCTFIMIGVLFCIMK